MNRLPITRTASVTDAPIVAYVVATAFHPLDVCQWLIPDPPLDRPYSGEPLFPMWRDPAPQPGSADEGGS